MVGLQQRARRDQLGAPGVHGNLRVAGHGGLFAPGDQAQCHGQTLDAVTHGLQGSGVGRAGLVNTLVGVAKEHLRKQGVGLHLRVAHQPDAGRGPRVGGLGAVFAFGEHRHLGAVAALAGCQVQHFDEGALADHQLTGERIGLGQQARHVHAQHDGVRRVQVHQPRLQVVRVGCQQGVRQHPTADLQAVGRGVPGRNRFGRQTAVAAGQAGHGGGGDESAACDAQHLSSVHGGAPR